MSQNGSLGFTRFMRCVMVDKANSVNNLGAVSNTASVSNSKATSSGDVSIHGTSTVGSVGDGLETGKSEFEKLSDKFQELIKDGTLKQNSYFFGLIKVDSYKYVCDGKKTLGEIKKELGLADGIIKSRNYGYNDDKMVPKKGTKLNLAGEDFPREKASFQDNDGNELRGFEKSTSGKIYYIVQSGDTASGLKTKFNGVNSLKGYNTGSLASQAKDEMDSIYSDKPKGVLRAGSVYLLPKK